MAEDFIVDETPSTPVQISSKVGQEQIHDLLFGEKLSWQAIIYDLINTEQLDPWNIDLSLLTNRYLEKVRELEEANFFVSSKVLLAASLLLRIKSEILLNQDIPSLDDILFGKKEEKKIEQGKLDFDDDEFPEIVPRTPLPRFRKVTLQELMSALGKAITTETRRIKKEILIRQQEKETEIALPKNAFNIQNKISEVYSKLKGIFSNREERFPFSELSEKNRDERLAVFVSLLHLDNQQKIWLEQEGHFEEIWILLKEIYLNKNKDKLDKIMAEIEAMQVEHEKEMEIEHKLENHEEGFESIEQDFADEAERVGIDSGFSNKVEEQDEDSYST